MRTRISLLILLAGVLTGPVGSAQVEPNWVLARVVTGPTGANGISIELAGSATLTGTGPAVFGHGLALRGFGAHLLSVWNVGGDGLSVTTSRDLGGYDVQVSPPTGDGYTFEYSAWLNLRFEPAETIVLVVFAPNATLGDLSAAATAASGEITFTSFSGTGATAIPLVDPERDGMGAQAGPAGAAVATEYSASPAAGIVGAIVTRECEGPCTAQWEGPGVSGGWTGVGAHALFGGIANPTFEWPSFVGPAGEWTWRWTGAMLADDAAPIWLFGSPVIAAWAPIGEDWTRFEE